jgi:hypothetical protein
MTTTAIKERPILFSGEMVRAILDGRKTQTRRIVKPLPEHGLISCHYNKTGWANMTEPNEHGIQGCKCDDVRCPFGFPGERLWVRESFVIESFGAGVAQIRYKADNARGDNRGVSCRKLPDRVGGVPSIHMPRYCSRITLEITDVRVERLMEISEQDAMSEGAPPSHPSIDAVSRQFGYQDFSRSYFAQLWESINGPESWSENPWVWVVEFRKIEE